VETKSNLTYQAIPDTLRVQHRVFVTKVFLILGAAIMLLSSLADFWLLDKPFLSMFEAFFGLLSITLLLYVHKIKRTTKAVAYMIVIFSAIVILVVMFWLQPDPSILLWSGFFPLIAYFLLGLFPGTIAHILFSIVLIVLLTKGWHSDLYQLDVRWMINLVETQIAYGVFGFIFTYTKKYAIEQTTLLSTVDALTGALNRKMFVLLFSEKKAVSRRSHQPLSLIMIDIDHFKSINDLYGHPAGDTVLKEFVKIIQTNLRTNDFLFRWGGEEFVLLLPGQSLDEADALAQRLRNSIRDHVFGIPGTLTASFGITEIHLDETDEATFQRLDRALYRAKELGRDRIEILP